MSFSLTGPLTFRMMERVLSSMNSTLTWVIPPLLPVRPNTRVTFASLTGTLAVSWQSTARESAVLQHVYPSVPSILTMLMKCACQVQCSSVQVARNASFVVVVGTFNSRSPFWPTKANLPAIDGHSQIGGEEGSLWTLVPSSGLGRKKVISSRILAIRPSCGRCKSGTTTDEHIRLNLCKLASRSNQCSRCTHARACLHSMFCVKILSRIGAHLRTAKAGRRGKGNTFTAQETIA